MIHRLTLALPLLFLFLFSQAWADDSEFEVRLVVLEGTKGAIQAVRKGEAGQRDLMVWCSKDVLMNTVSLLSARAYNDVNSGWSINLKLDEWGKEQMGKISTEHRGSGIAIFANRQLVAVPTLDQPLTTGSLILTGKFTEKEARDIVAIFQSGIRVRPGDPKKWFGKGKK